MKKNKKKNKQNVVPAPNPVMIIRGTLKSVLRIIKWCLSRQKERIKILLLMLETDCLLVCPLITSCPLVDNLSSAKLSTSSKITLPINPCMMNLSSSRIETAKLSLSRDAEPVISSLWIRLMTEMLSSRALADSPAGTSIM